MQSVQDPSDNELTNADGIEGKHMKRHRHSLQSDRSMIFFFQSVGRREEQEEEEREHKRAFLFIGQNIEYRITRERPLFGCNSPDEC